ncbi:hypothetical protein PsorP6_009731 [Peronosclerospora sorghi]|uniref:Uncharacterized protein n=1 Tax=Peronosclerospora sorghi TaxID=230839 RepID=A0ACC0W029_9STRA|nr:hypothetical protein PsorP6_009731 [Peronosclerospora sorghi]
MHVTREPPSGTGHFLYPRPAHDRPFACPLSTCDGRIHRKFTLHEHLKTHTGEQPHACPVDGCGKRFSTSGNLTRHRKVHTMHRHPCPTPHCARDFTSRDKLARHLNVHLARTPHTCTIDGCYKTFSTAGNLTRHRRTRHHAVPTSDGRARRRAPAPPHHVFKTLSFAEHLRPFPMQELHPVVPGALLVKTPVWSAFPLLEEDATSDSSRDAPRFSDQDVRDLLDCLSVESPARVAIQKVGGRDHS